MLHTSATYDDAATLLKDFDEHNAVFRFSTFADLEVSGGCSEAAFLDCEFRQLDWYWGMFTLALFAKCKFSDCTFRGTAFMACRFLECSFTRCRFVNDSLAADCSFEETKWFDCTQNGCVGLSDTAVRVSKSD